MGGGPHGFGGRRQGMSKTQNFTSQKFWRKSGDGGNFAILAKLFGVNSDREM